MAEKILGLMLAGLLLAAAWLAGAAVVGAGIGLGWRIFKEVAAW